MYPADDTPGDREAQASFQVESTSVSIEQAGSCLWISTKLTTKFATKLLKTNSTFEKNHEQPLTSRSFLGASLAGAIDDC